METRLLLYSKSEEACQFGVCQTRTGFAFFGKFAESREAGNEMDKRDGFGGRGGA
jgi:hypothetical protein